VRREAELKLRRAVAEPLVIGAEQAGRSQQLARLADAGFKRRRAPARGGSCLRPLAVEEAPAPRSPTPTGAA